MLVPVDEPRITLADRDFHRHDLLGELSRVDGGDRPLVGADREFVLFPAADAVPAAQVLRRLQHAAGHRIVASAGGDTSAGEPVVERCRAPLTPQRIDSV